MFGLPNDMYPYFISPLEPKMQRYMICVTKRKKEAN